MKIKLAVSALVLAAFSAGAVVAAGTPQENRQQLMKGIGGAMGSLAKIAKGEAAYDAATVKGALETMATNAKAFPNEFPAGSETGMDTEASPKIWENMDDFKAKSAKLASDAEMLLAQLPADQAAVGDAMKTLGGDCQSCHETYRMKK